MGRHSGFPRDTMAGWVILADWSTPAGGFTNPYRLRDPVLAFVALEIQKALFYGRSELAGAPEYDNAWARDPPQSCYAA